MKFDDDDTVRVYGSVTFSLKLYQKSQKWTYNEVGQLNGLGGYIYLKVHTFSHEVYINNQRKRQIVATVYEREYAEDIVYVASLDIKDGKAYRAPTIGVAKQYCEDSLLKLIVSGPKKKKTEEEAPKRKIFL